jgi:hypothetical protein
MIKEVIVGKRAIHILDRIDYGANQVASQIFGNDIGSIA